MVIRKKFRHLATTLAAAASFTVMAHAAQAQEYELSYGHMNSPTSVVGMQADWLAEEVAKNTNLRVTVRQSALPLSKPKVSFKLRNTIWKPANF